MDALTQALLDTCQRDFPITPRPFASIADSLAAQDLNQAPTYSESDILSKVKEIKQQGIVTRIGPVFDHQRAGSSLLAAMKIPPAQLKCVAEKINQYAEVNHNYGRENAYNLWFVVTASSQGHLQQVLNDMEASTGFPILRLPMERSYHIDLGFRLWPSGKKQSSFIAHLESSTSSDTRQTLKADTPSMSEEKQQELRAMIQDGLPLVSKPFEQIAGALNETEAEVMSTFAHWLGTGMIKRIGLITNHHRLGYTSNAMVVWNVPEDQVDEVGEAFKQSGLVSLCYRRTRHLPEWPYNLYCMIHSRDREMVAEHVSALVSQCSLQAIPKEILFSNCQFKQKGGQYIVPAQGGVSSQNVQESASNQQFI